MEQLTIGNGNIYLTAKLYETYFSSVEAIVLLAQEKHILIMPVQNASGGLLLKIRNAKGDRVVHASEFFLFNNIECHEKKVVDAHWDSNMAALKFDIGQSSL